MDPYETGYKLGLSEARREINNVCPRPARVDSRLLCKTPLHAERVSSCRPNSRLHGHVLGEPPNILRENWNEAGVRMWIV